MMSDPAEDRFFPTFQHFEYRKIIRLSGGEIYERGSRPLLTAFVALLWIFIFVVSSMRITKGALTFQFYDYEDSQSAEQKTYSLFTSVSFLISLIVLVVGLKWQIRNIIPLFAAVLVATAVASVIVKSVTPSPEAALAVVTYLCTLLLAMILLHYLWLYYFIPSIVKTRWVWMQQDASLASFPYATVLYMCLYFLIILPLWVPIAAITLVALLFHCLGCPSGELLSLASPMRLNFNYWDFEEEPGRVTYTRRRAALQCLFSPPPKQVRYTGERDALGRPHGLGEWKDTDRGGEVLRGIFQEGIPVAPYITREGAGGGVMRSLRVGFATFCAGDVNEIEMAPRWLDEQHSQGMCYGVAAVEACVSGTFYHDFPQSVFLQGQPPFQSVSMGTAWESLMSHLDRDIDDIGGAVGGGAVGVSAVGSVPGRTDEHKSHEMGPESPSHLSQPPQVQVQAQEVLLFIPGFNSCLRNTLNMFGQFVMLGGFPPEVVPWLLCWPMGSVASYSASQRVTESDRFAAKITQLLADFAAQGVKRVSIIGHSMGARALLSYLAKSPMVQVRPRHVSFDLEGQQPGDPLPTDPTDPVLPPRPPSPPPSPPHSPSPPSPAALPALGSLFFINPEADAQAFVAAYPQMRAVSESITVYVDVTDTAIYWSEVMNSLQHWWRSKGVPTEQQASPSYTPSHSCGTGSCSGTGSCGSCGPGTCTLYPSLGRLTQGLGDLVGPMDVDVINASSISDNVDPVRHCHFDLSRETLEDIREALVGRRRARERTGRLVESSKNYYDFLVAPPYVHH